MENPLEAISDQGFRVKLPSGANFLVLTTPEQDYVNERVRRYETDYSFKNVSDHQDLDKLVMLELFMHRWSLWLSKGMDYFDDPIDAKDLSSRIENISKESRLLKKNLGMDKPARDRQRGDDCHDDQTEVLTEFGWCLFKDVVPETRLATRNPEGILEYQFPTAVQSQWYEGDLFVYETPSLNFAITPNHRILLFANNKWGYREIKSLKGTTCPYSLARTSIIGLDRSSGSIHFSTPGTYIAPIGRRKGKKWTEEDIQYLRENHATGSMVDICEHLGRAKKDVCQHAYQLGLPKRKSQFLVNKSVELPEVPLIKFARWLGIFLSEGLKKRGTKGCALKVTQTKSEGIRFIDKVYEDLGWPYKRVVTSREVQWYFYNTNLANYVKELQGEGHELHIPNKVFHDWTRDEMEALFEGLMMGDGCYNRETGHPIYYSSSSRTLVDDVQRLLAHIGFSGRVTKAYEKGRVVTDLKGRIFIARYDGWKCSVRRAATTTLLVPNMEKRFYAGMIYCFTVPNGTLLTRRGDNPVPIWTGNSVSTYLENLRIRAKEFGVMRNEQFYKAIELFQQLDALITYYNNCDETERNESQTNMEDVFRWIEEICLPEFRAIDQKFKKEKQTLWIRQQ